MRIIFAGTPEFAAKALEALIQSEHEVVYLSRIALQGADAS